MKCSWARIRKLITYENNFLVVVILVVWILFSLPAFFFYISYEESGAGWLGNITEFVKLLDSSCSSSNYTAEIEDCEIKSFAEVSSSIGRNSKCLPYREGPCTEEGTTKYVQPNYPVIQLALKAVTSEADFNCTSAISEINKTIKSLSGLLGKQCLKEGIPFLCDYLLPACDGNGELQHPSQDDCNDVQNNYCKLEWNLASQIPSLSPILPDCSLLQSTLPNTVPTSRPTLGTNNSWSSDPNCHPLFVQKNCICLPSCSKFRMNTEVGQVIEDIAIAITLIVAIVSPIIYFVFFMIRRKVMGRYPAVLVLYGSLGIFVVAIAVALARIVPGNALFCSHTDFLFTLLDSPTPYCTISGFLFQFLIVMLFSFWLLHIVHIWISVAFPHIAKKVKKHDKIIHVVTVVLIVLLSLIGPVVAVAKYPYIVPRLPTLTCFSSDLNWTFYSLILPSCIAIALASTFLILLFNTTYKNQSLFRKGECLNTPEIKILFTSGVYIVAGVFVLVRYGHSLSVHENFIESQLTYGVCHLFGNDPGCPSHDNVVDKTTIVLNCITFFILGLIPLTSLTYAVKTSDLKKLARCFKPSRKAETSQMNISSGTQGKNSVFTTVSIAATSTIHD